MSFILFYFIFTFQEETQAKYAVYNRSNIKLGFNFFMYTYLIRLLKSFT